MGKTMVQKERNEPLRINKLKCLGKEQNELLKIELTLEELGRLGVK